MQRLCLWLDVCINLFVQSPAMTLEGWFQARLLVVTAQQTCLAAGLLLITIIVVKVGEAEAPYTVKALFSGTDDSDLMGSHVPWRHQ